MTALVLSTFLLNATLCVKPWAASISFVFCQVIRPSPNEKDIQRVSKKREIDELSQGYIKEKGFTVNQMWECE